MCREDDKVLLSVAGFSSDPLVHHIARREQELAERGNKHIIPVSD